MEEAEDISQSNYQRAEAAEAKLAGAHVAELVLLLKEYREKTPLGHQPHMIAHRVDEILALIEKETGND